MTKHGKGSSKKRSRSSDMDTDRALIRRKSRERGGGLYLRILMGGFTTWQINEKGEAYLQHERLKEGDHLRRGMFAYMKHQNMVYTGGSGAGPDIIDQRRQEHALASGQAMTSARAVPPTSNASKQPVRSAPHHPAPQDFSQIFSQMNDERRRRMDVSQAKSRSVADDPIVRQKERTVPQTAASLPSSPVPAKPRPTRPLRKHRDKPASSARGQSKGSKSTVRQMGPTPASGTGASTAKAASSKQELEPLSILRNANVDQGPSSRPLALDLTPDLNEPLKLDLSVNDQPNHALLPIEGKHTTPHDQVLEVPSSLGLTSESSPDLDPDEAHQVLAQWLRETVQAPSTASPPQTSRLPRPSFLPLLVIICLVLLALLAFSGIHTR